MTLEEFRETLSQDKPPGEMADPLLALWWDARDNWDKAHAAALYDERPQGAWVHAYLHRKEGDLSNAGYWYARAGKPVARGDLELEWQQIAAELLGG